MKIWVTNWWLNTDWIIVLRNSVFSFGIDNNFLSPVYYVTLFGITINLAKK